MRLNQRLSVTTLGLLTGALLVTILLHLPILNQPFGRDQGIFAYIGDGILHGYVPYRDAWDHKPPGIDFAYALAFALLGRQMVSLHLLELASILLTGIMLFSVGRRLFGVPVGLLSTLFYGAGSALMFEWWDRGQAEFFMTLPVTLCLYCALRSGLLSSEQGRVPAKPRTRTLWLGIAGFFGGLSLYFKPTAGVMLLFLALLVALDAAGPAVRGALRRREDGPAETRPKSSLVLSSLSQAILGVLILSVGALVALIPLVAYFGLNHALEDFWEANIVFNTYHVQTGANLTLAQMISATLDFGSRMGFLAPLAALGAVFVVLRRQLGGIAVIFWLAFLMSGVWVQGKFFSYHWSTLLAPLSLLATVGLEVLWNGLAEHWGQLFTKLEVLKANPATGLAVVTLPLLALAYSTVLYQDQTPKLGRDLPFVLGATTQSGYLANFGHNLRGTDVYSFSAAQETATYVDDHTAPQDTVLVWGFQALVNFLADRRAPTRYIFNYPLTIEQPDSDLRAKARSTFLNDIARNKPKYIILVTNDVNPLQTVDSVTLLNGFPEFKNLLATDYVLEKDIADFHLYRPKVTP